MSGKEQRRMDRFIVIPFSSTCRSGSCVDVVDARHGKKPQDGADGAAAGGGAGKPKGESLLARLLKGFKNLSQIFAIYEDEDEEEEEEEQEMVIGLPTDVKHVAHIGWDGSTSTTTSVRSWNRAAPPPLATAASTSSSAAAAAPPTQQPQPQPQSSPLPPALSVRQFELAMAAQAAASTGTATATAASTSTSAPRHCHS